MVTRQAPTRDQRASTARPSTCTKSQFLSPPENGCASVGFDLGQAANGAGQILDVVHLRRLGVRARLGVRQDCETGYERMSPLRAAHYPLYTSLCTGQLNAIRKQNAFSAVLPKEGRVVGPCWEKL